jgi:orotidine-5'-phosphate decarboxylase
MAGIALQERLIVALDVADVEQAQALVDELADGVSFYKIGLPLQFSGGIALARSLVERKKKVFMDTKVLDIGNTVTNTVRAIARLGVHFLTIHGIGGAVEAAVAGRGTHDLKLLCVTALTSMDADSLKELGLDCTVDDYVLIRTEKAVRAGCDGVIASGREAKAIRERAGDKLIIVTPGVRSEGVPHHDQKRVMTPRQAIAQGADYIVVGREIINSAKPAATAEHIIAQVAEGLQQRRK